MFVHEKDLNGNETKKLNMHAERIKIDCTKEKNALAFRNPLFLKCWQWHQTFLIFLKIK